MMATSVFDDKAIVPDDSMVGLVLADKVRVWDEVKSHVLGNYQDVTYGWKYANKKAGWVLVFAQKKRTLFYFVPCSGYFRLGFVFGEKAMREIEGVSLPEHIVEMISAASICAAGHSFFVDVKDEGDFEAILVLLRIKAVQS